jgi:hypothetical protein
MTHKQITLTAEQAEALFTAIQEHIYHRSGGDVRAYVDGRYAAQDEAWRNVKIGEIQRRFDALNQVREKLTTVYTA